MILRDSLNSTLPIPGQLFSLFGCYEISAITNVLSEIERRELNLIIRSENSNFISALETAYLMYVEENDLPELIDTVMGVLTFNENIEQAKKAMLNKAKHQNLSGFHSDRLSIDSDSKSSSSKHRRKGSHDPNPPKCKQMANLTLPIDSTEHLSSLPSHRSYNNDSGEVDTEYNTNVLKFLLKYEGVEKELIDAIVSIFEMTQITKNQANARIKTFTKNKISEFLCPELMRDQLEEILSERNDNFEMMLIDALKMNNPAIALQNMKESLVDKTFHEIQELASPRKISIRSLRNKEKLSLGASLSATEGKKRRSIDATSVKGSSSPHHHDYFQSLFSERNRASSFGSASSPSKKSKQLSSYTEASGELAEFERSFNLDELLKSLLLSINEDMGYQLTPEENAIIELLFKSRMPDLIDVILDTEYLMSYTVANALSSLKNLFTLSQQELNEMKSSLKARNLSFDKYFLGYMTRKLRYFTMDEANLLDNLLLEEDQRILNAFKDFQEKKSIIEFRNRLKDICSKRNTSIQGTELYNTSNFNMLEKRIMSMLNQGNFKNIWILKDLKSFYFQDQKHEKLWISAMEQAEDVCLKFVEEFFEEYLNGN